MHTEHSECQSFVISKFAGRSNEKITLPQAASHSVEMPFLGEFYRRLGELNCQQLRNHPSRTRPSQRCFITTVTIDEERPEGQAAAVCLGEEKFAASWRDNSGLIKKNCADDVVLRGQYTRTSPTPYGVDADGRLSLIHI